MILKWISLVLLFLRELILSALKVALLVVSPKPRLRPGIIAYPLTLTGDAEITLFANMITLTPGTLSVDVSDDKRTLFIHAIDIESREKLIGDIAAGFETKVLQVFR
jgi:multicomponent Na+:H+ antiporter subunit E